MLISRSGVPRIIRGTAPAVPGAPITESELAAFQFLSRQATQWVRIENTGPGVLRMYFTSPGLDPAGYAWSNDYWEIPVGAGMDLPLEIQDLWLAGAAEFQMLVGRRLG